MQVLARPGCFSRCRLCMLSAETKEIFHPALTAHLSELESSLFKTAWINVKIGWIIARRFMMAKWLWLLSLSFLWVKAPPPLAARAAWPRCVKHIRADMLELWWMLWTWVLCPSGLLQPLGRPGGGDFLPSSEFPSFHGEMSELGPGEL